MNCRFTVLTLLPLWTPLAGRTGHPPWVQIQGNSRFMRLVLRRKGGRLKWGRGFIQLLMLPVAQKEIQFERREWWPSAPLILHSRKEEIAFWSCHRMIRAAWHSLFLSIVFLTTCALLGVTFNTFKRGTCTFFLHLPISLFLNCPHLGLRIKETKEVYEGEVTELTPCETENPMGGYGKTISHVIIGLKTGKGTKQLKVRFEATGIYWILMYIVCMYVVFPRMFCAHFHSWTPAFTRVCRKNVWKLEMWSTSKQTVELSRYFSTKPSDRDEKVKYEVWANYLRVVLGS